MGTDWAGPRLRASLTGGSWLSERPCFKQNGGTTLTWTSSFETGS